MTEESKDSIEYIICGCGCGQELPKYDWKGRERKYLNRSHSGRSTFKGKKHSEETKQKISKDRLENIERYSGENHYLFGKSPNEESIVKMIRTKRDRYVKENHPRYGVKLTDETKKKIGGANKKSDDEKTIKHTGGYIYLPISNHPNSDKDGYVAQHVVVMSEHLGRPLVKGEHIHHKNKNRRDNRIENLELHTNSTHMQVHRKEYKEQEVVGRICDKCGTDKTIMTRKKNKKGILYEHMCWRTNPLDKSQWLCNTCWRAVYYSITKK